MTLRRRECVERWADELERVLRSKDHKPGWENLTLAQFWHLVYQEFDEARMERDRINRLALNAERDQTDARYYREREEQARRDLAEEACQLAVCAMFLADHLEGYSAGEERGHTREAVSSGE